MSRDTLTISGMTCAACAKRIEKVTGKLAGVSKASVNFAAEKLTVEYDETALHLSAIRDEVVRIGYGVVEGAKHGEVTIPIAGMTCAACAQRIEKVLAKLAGVEKSSVNLATEKATVIYDPETIKLSQLKEAIFKLGYRPLEIEKKGAVDEDRIRKEKEIRTLKTRLIVSAIFCVPLLYLAMAP
ncbi:MAG: copper ion binding protein, partial [Synergistaceae bacterium]|nr:copper ion binding protein [Synergistaceae bacterium]